MVTKPECKHNKGTYTSGYGSLWGPFGQFCNLCGFCVSDPDFPARPEEAKGVRQMAADGRAWEKRWAAMTPEEQKQWQKELLVGIDARLKSDEMVEQLKPFREGLTYRPYGPYGYF